MVCPGYALTAFSRNQVLGEVLTSSSQEPPPQANNNNDNTTICIVLFLKDLQGAGEGGEKQAAKIRDFFTALALCHTVIPERFEDSDEVHTYSYINIYIYLLLRT